MDDSRRAGLTKGTVSLHVYCPGRCVAKVNVRPGARIQELHRLIPGDAVTFVSNGVVLVEKQTFSFYGIRERDIIVSVPCQPTDREMAKWIDLTRDCEAFSERIASIIDQGTSREAGRIRDFQITRMERKPRTFRRLTNNCQRPLLPLRPQKAFRTILPERADGPSIEPLPVFWPILATHADGLETSETVPLLTDDRELVSLKADPQLDESCNP
jgi:hypothetical protein